MIIHPTHIPRAEPLLRSQIHEPRQLPNTHLLARGVVLGDPPRVGGVGAADGVGELEMVEVVGVAGGVFGSMGGEC